MANKHSGFKLISNIDADSKKIENLPDPTADQEPATKNYINNEYGYQFFRWYIGRIDYNGGTESKDFQLPSDAEGFGLEITFSARLGSSVVKKVFIKWATYGFLYNNVLEGATEIITLYEIGDAPHKGDIVLSITAVGSNNQIRITLTNNDQGYHSEYGTAGLKFQFEQWRKITEA